VGSRSKATSQGVRGADPPEAAHSKPGLPLFPFTNKNSSISNTALAKVEWSCPRPSPLRGDDPAVASLAYIILLVNWWSNGAKNDVTELK